jgi:hypothetical protein
MSRVLKWETQIPDNHGKAHPDLRQLNRIGGRSVRQGVFHLRGHRVFVGMGLPCSLRPYRHEGCFRLFVVQCSSSGAFYGQSDILTSPLHYRFQLSGWSETQVVQRF